MNEIPKVVFSKTLERPEWPEAQIAAGELADEIARLKEGGYRLAQPAALGDGLALFKNLPGRLALELVEAHTYATGAASHVYRPRKG